MKKYLLLLLFACTATIAFAQTWQQTFQITDTPRYVEELADGKLEVHYLDDDELNYKLTVSAEGDSLGIEYYTNPAPTLSSYFEGVPFDIWADSLAYYDGNGSLIGQFDITNVPYYDLYSTNEYVLITEHILTGNLGGYDNVWIYSNTGTLIYENTFDGPFSINSITGFSKKGEHLLLKRKSSTGTLPQGTGQALNFRYLLDVEGNLLCSNGALDVWTGNSEHIQGIAYNGAENCGHLGVYTLGPFTPQGQGAEGQYIPCSDFRLPSEYAIPANRGMIGLQSDGFAILGEEEGTVLTRIDCAIPYETLCLYTTQTYIQESICPSESYVLGAEVFNEPGEYEVTLNDMNGCDSIVNLNLEWSDPYVTNLQEAICIDESFTVGTNVFSDSGEYEVIFTSSNGCDSIINLSLEVLTPELTITPVITYTQNMGAITLNPDCPDCTYEWNNGEITENIEGLGLGTYTVNITEATGCVSTYTFEIDASVATSDLENSIQINFNSLAQHGAILLISIIQNTTQIELGQINIYNLGGQLLRSNEANALVKAPSTQGLYLVEIKSEEGEVLTIRKLIVY